MSSSLQSQRLWGRERALNLWYSMTSSIVWKPATSNSRASDLGLNSSRVRWLSTSQNKLQLSSFSAAPRKYLETEGEFCCIFGSKRPSLGIRKLPYMGFSAPFPAFLQCSPWQCSRQTHQHPVAQTPFHVPSCIFFKSSPCMKCPPLSPAPTYTAHEAWVFRVQ